MEKYAGMKWSKEASGVYKARIGKNIKTLLEYTESEPKLDAINRLEDNEFPIQLENKIKFCRINHRLAVMIPYCENEKIFGFGLQFKTLNQTGKVMNLKTNHYGGGEYGGRDDGRTHAPCPVYFSSEGYGVFFNTPAPLTVYAATASQKSKRTEFAAKDRNTDKNWTDIPAADHIEASLNADGLEIVVFSGINLQDSVSRYNLYCGGGFLPPKWGLGFWYRFAWLTEQDEIIKGIDEFFEHGINVDVAGIEPGWQSKAYPCTYEWSPERFPDPKKLCLDLAERGTRVNLWMNPYISPSSKLYKKIYKHSASHTVWNGLVPDYSIPEARQILAKQHKAEHLDMGIGGYKIDEIDGYDMWLWPDHAKFPSGTDAETMRQLYGVLAQKMIAEMFREKNLRTYGLARASNSNGSAYPFVIYNDRYDFDEYMTGLVTGGFSGVSWTPEIRHGENASDWIRRFQLGLFSPMLLLNSWASGAKPWSDEKAAQELADIIKFRKMLLPYLYNAYAKYCFSGTPPFRAVMLDYPNLKFAEKYQEAILHDENNPYSRKTMTEINDELLIGDFLLAAFMRPNENSRIVILPEGKWYDFYTKEFAGSDAAVRYEAKDGEMPLFVKEGGMIPLATGDKTLTIKCYGERGNCVIYDDDGTSFDYEQGAYNEIRVEFDRSGGEFIYSASYVREMSEKNYTNFIFE
ncbi:MAG: DUF5110 domain-containing protein [Oscillospiraceae bacterium]|nr:DUF5110 domain-containing protein [Oscillospiraceae bacterium]